MAEKKSLIKDCPLESYFREEFIAKKRTTDKQNLTFQKQYQSIKLKGIIALRRKSIWNFSSNGKNFTIDYFNVM